jgi:hydroxypyruvate isomerase
MASLRFEANISILFTELHLLERPAAARAAGFDAVELWWPFSVPVPAAAELDRLAEALGEAGVALVGLNFDGGDLAAGERGLLSLPGAGARFADNVACALSFAQSQGTTVLNALYGNRVDGVDSGAQDEIALERLAYAADAAAIVGARVVLETQNRVDSPLYPLRDPAQAAALVERMRAEGHDNVGLLCDYYHLAMEGYDLRTATDAYLHLVDHVQVADAPGRHEPGTGAIDYVEVLGHLAGAGYAGWIGCEYRPSGPSAESFGWLERIGDRAASASGQSGSRPPAGGSAPGAGRSGLDGREDRR